MAEGLKEAPAPASTSSEVWQELLSRPRPLIMGVINITPDSFADGGLFFDHDTAVNHALALAAAGADILDFGGESTRPYSDPTPLDEELSRVLPVIEQVRAQTPVAISIDTYKSRVARAALAVGANIINDISAMRFDPDMVHVAREYGAPAILMHMQGTPREMQANPHYDDLIGELRAFFAERLDFALTHGLSRNLLVLDPGIGFGKTFRHNMEILNNMDAFLNLGCPLLIGPSRKAFLGHLLGGLPPAERDIATLAALTVAVQRGVHIVRVHNVAYTKQFFTALNAISQVQRHPLA
jgi:dihydropteroate synthase|uniref:Dihydropteroate synthase n=1 Tax=Desulfobacca acetoxidans TaxID=60893 RepID=A0A7V6DQT5_9BACT